MARASLGSLVVSLGLDAAEFVAGINRAEYQAQKMARSVDRAVKGVTGVLKTLTYAGAVAGAAGVKLGADWIGAAANLDDLAEVTGASVEGLSKLEQQARISGASLDSIGQNMVRLSKAINGTDEESKKASRALNALGLSAGELKKLDTAEALKRVSVALNRFEDSNAKSALAVDLFGRSGAQLLPFLKDLANDSELAATVTAKQAAEAEELGKSYRRIINDVRNFGQAIALDALPWLRNMLQQMSEGVRIAGGFGNALRLFGLSTISQSNAGAKIREITAEIERLQTARARAIEQGRTRGNLIPNFDREIADARKQLEFAKLLQRQTVPTGNFDTPGEMRRFGLGASGKQVLDYAASTETAAKKVTEAAGRFEDYEMRMRQAVGNAINSSDVIKAGELVKQIEILDNLFFDSGLSADVYESAMRRLTGTTENLAFQSKVAAEELRKQQQIQDEAKRIYEATRTPAEQLAAQIEKLNRLLDAGSISWDTYGRAVLDAQDEFDRATKSLPDDIKKGSDAARDLGLTFSSAFEDAIAGGKGLREILKSLEQDIMKIVTRKLITEPLADWVTGVIKGMGSGGGGGVFSLGNILGSWFGGGKAMGGPVSPNQAYMVGEKGRELFVPNTAGNIVPNNAIGGSTVINFTVNTQDAQSFQRNRTQILADLQQAASAAASRNL